MNRFAARPSLRFWLCLASALIAVGLWGALAAPTFAQEPVAENEACLACHSDKTLSKTLPSGEPLSLYVDGSLYHSTLHGFLKVTCVQCHEAQREYPHPPFTATDRRDVTLQMNQACAACHAENFAELKDSIHGQKLAEGNRNAAVCSDCHTAHAVTVPGEPRTKIPQTCAQCHSTISQQYAESVHGAALFDDENPDVPTCESCHGVHTIQDPTTVRFRLNSPQICADCHTNKAMMDKYGLSTDVLNTYVADFHGTTVELFAKQSPDAPTNKPVCYDCHGIHNIKATDDPNSTVFKENLLVTCKRCHPDATTESFAAAWMGHYIASPEQYPLVYYVNLFYWLLIPVTMLALLGFIATDVFRRARVRFGRKKQGVGEDI